MPTSNEYVFMVHRYCIMHKYNSINHTSEKIGIFNCPKINYDNKKTYFYYFIYLSAHL